MQPEYLARLGDPVRAFVREVERNANIDIAVVPDFRLNDGGPFGQGHLEIIIKASGCLLFAPTNGYFPDGAVRHEVLHVKRFHVDGVPRLTLADSEAWDAVFSNALGQLDNAIEHVAIVPVELQHHPERREHWEAVMRDACSGLPDVPDGERNLAICMHWTFLRHALPGSPQIEIARDFALKHALLGMADRFADHFLAVVTSKEEIVRLLFLTFPEIPWNRAGLEYLNRLTGTRQTSFA